MQPLSRAMSDPLYRLTEAGRNAWESQDIAVPADYRLILWLIDFHGQDCIQTLLQRYPAARLHEWLAEMEELKLIEPVPPGAAGRVPLAAEDPDKTLAFSPEAQARFEAELQSASQSLLKGKIYLPKQRLRAPAPLRKSRAQAVVLIVEDDPDQLALADLRVSMEGHTVWVADSARTLQETLATKGTPDLILLDVMLPDGDGFEILSNLRRHRTYAALPVIILTAKSEASDIRKGLELGADGYITKPYSKNLLATIVSQVLARG
jgi:CheY-like chemotaxis protein